MAEEEEEEGSEAEAVAEMEAPQGSWLKQFVILAILVLVGQGVVAYVLVTQQVLPKFGVEEQGVEDTTAEPEVVKRKDIVVEAPSLFEIDFTDTRVINPQNDHSVRYLSVYLVLELDRPETLTLRLGNDVTAAEIKSIARKVLTTTWYSEMDDVDEREALRKKIMVEINSSGLLGIGSVIQVYFKRFLLQ